ncbi:MerC domain-containing protein [Sphingobium boeckii]|uniref:Putative ABC-type exoprotein transport system permease subunit n=1 Tax=Sphingobium boeckii TaxID=1082345 RepID=A0A7W9EDU4_9SPHN|nr:MerC domain-containing protein [Sphingobium boeckii]MBB5685638.1 putative ABC-type exoprotein transport system permease subunit [Sphingobium boeckii]
MSDARTPAIDIAESAAVTASLLCLAHCLLIPLAIAMLPLLSDMLTLPEAFHIGLLIFAAPSALFALSLGWRQHGRAAPLVIGLGGIAALSAALAFPVQEALLTTAGSILLITAHITNWHLRHATRP